MDSGGLWSLTEGQIPGNKVPYAQRVLNIFLPAGFPASVTEDYVGFVFPPLRPPVLGRRDAVRFPSQLPALKLISLRGLLHQGS